MSRSPAYESPTDRLRALLAQERLHVMPCCFDALSARMTERAGFDLTFMSGFAVSAARLGKPDTGLISYGEMLDQGRNICDAIEIPVIGDADTGYGNEMNVRRTIEGYARAGFAGAMIEDQVAPKRCGHTRGKEVVDRETATRRLKAAVDAREAGADLLVMARTDARASHGLDEATRHRSHFEASLCEHGRRPAHQGERPRRRAASAARARHRRSHRTRTRRRPRQPRETAALHRRRTAR